MAPLSPQAGGWGLCVKPTAGPTAEAATKSTGPTGARSGSSLPLHTSPKREPGNAKERRDYFLASRYDRSKSAHSASQDVCCRHVSRLVHGHRPVPLADDRFDHRGTCPRSSTVRRFRLTTLPWRNKSCGDALGRKPSGSPAPNAGPSPPAVHVNSGRMNNLKTVVSVVSGPDTAQSASIRPFLEFGMDA